MSETQSANENIVLSVNNIEVIYDHVILVLKGVSLEVPEGGIVALLGANGAGKTTTIKSISNILGTERGEVTKGSIEFMGEKVENLTPTDLVQRGVKAGELVKQAARIVGGGGGGRPHLAQAGGRDAQKLSEALDAVPGMVAGMLNEG